MKKIVVLFIIAFIASKVHTQVTCNNGWVAQSNINGNENNFQLVDMKIDKNKNTYTIGKKNYGGSVYLGPNLSVSVSNNSANYALLAKINSAGVYEWAKPFYIVNVDVTPYEIEIDEDNNLYIYGKTGSVPIQGVTAYFGDYVEPYFNTESWMVKMDSNGNVLWFRNNMVSLNFNFDYYNNAYFIYSSFNQTRFMKWDSSGTLVKDSSDNNISYITEYETDKEGNSYVVGNLYNTVQIGSTTLSPSFGISDIFIAKFDNQFNPIWAQKVGSPTHIDQNPTILIDSLGNCYIDCETNAETIVIGNTTLVPLFGKFHFKMNSQGDILWAKTGIGQPEYNGQYHLNSVSVNGNYYTATQTSNITETNSELILYKYNTDGNLVWSKSAIYTNPYSNIEFGHFEVDRYENCYFNGRFPHITNIFQTIEIETLFYGDTLVEPVSVPTNYYVMKMPFTGFGAIDFSYSTSELNISFFPQVSGYESLTWNFGDGNSSQTLNANHTYSDTGTYEVTLTLVDSCGNTGKKTKSVTIDGLLNLNEYIIENTQIIYPNPAKDEITISNLSKKSQIDILDINGRLVKSIVNDSNNQTINIAELAGGLYFLRVENKTYRFIKK